MHTFRYFLDMCGTVVVERRASVLENILNQMENMFATFRGVSTDAFGAYVLSNVADRQFIIVFSSGPVLF